ncbi:hypothetical protein DY000_02034606 [Brassica cretica]|uniref:GATA-type domain-containing protein n=1 Tax=Brassica cretica TaxID=69181 RepID=A0ABQ7DMF3_BRACR|nr:hypothetical protein DY000_02034606 [Brassica cretica]
MKQRVTEISRLDADVQRRRENASPAPEAMDLVVKRSTANGSVSFQNPNRAFPVKGTRSNLNIQIPQNAPKNKRQMKNKSQVSDSPDSYNSDGTIRMCTHCETTETPQWREGPCGPKTLCNACGIRFRSGCLLPEYRPSSSPSFIPSLHSNSHRKIIEMRRKDKPG